MYVFKSALMSYIRLVFDLLNAESGEVKVYFISERRK
jgi:hypothetical protein